MKTILVGAAAFACIRGPSGAGENGNPGLKQWEFLDASTGRNFAEEIRRFYIPDFSSWETDQATYRKEFAKLLRDLKPPFPKVSSKTRQTQP